MDSSCLADCLHWLQQLNLNRSHNDLQAVSNAARQLSLVPFACPVVTVAGTNGKGSTVALLERIMMAAGYRVGALTSPHLLHYNERIRINASMVSDQLLVKAFHAIATTAMQYALNFSDVNTLLAFYIFHQQALDIIILEVGMGGRLDATNIVDADISVITSIDMDHVAYLGDNRDSIAFEKAGIFRPDQPAVIGDMFPPASIQQYAQQIATPLYIRGQEFIGLARDNTSWSWQSQQQQWHSLPYPNIIWENAITTLKVIELLMSRFTITPSAIIAGLTQVSIPGRLQKLATRITTLVDVAHNPEACRYLAKYLQQNASPHRTFAVVGMQQDKDHQACMLPLLPVIDHWYVAGLAGRRGADKQILENVLQKLQASSVQAYMDVVAAYHAATAAADVGDRIIVFGSFQTVAEIIKSDAIHG